jgi:hypothetical protein
VGEGGRDGSCGAMDGSESSSLMRGAGDGVSGRDRPTPNATLFLLFPRLLRGAPVDRTASWDEGGGTGVLSSEASDGELGTSGDGERIGCIGAGPKGSQDPCLDSVISRIIEGVSACSNPRSRSRSAKTSLILVI